MDMLAIILTAVALVLVIEGIIPFISPRLWREMMARLCGRSDISIRVIGFISLLAGACLMYVVHAGLI